MRLTLGIFALAAGLLAVLACQSEAAKACLAQFSSAQQVVLEIDAEDATSVDGAVAAVDTALGACRSADRRGEVEELSRAHGELSAHRDRMRRRDELRSQRSELSPEELAARLESGDASCPRGQAYLHKKSGQRIRCTGPQPASMDRAQARDYFKRRGYKSTEVSPIELHFEYGAELVVLLYAPGGADGPPRCVVSYPAPDMSWQESVARLTGARPARLKPGATVSVESRRLDLTVEESPEKVIAHIGDCRGLSPRR